MKIGIRELKARAPQVVREVRETGESVEITYRGAVVARLTPAEDSRGYGDFATAWQHFDDVVQKIGKRPEPISPITSSPPIRRPTML